MVMDDVVLKLTADSAGMESSLFPVNAAPAVPAPAPTRPPISAPLPPPARPPIKAPPPAPPPIMTAERLPLPFCVTTYSSVLTRCGTPLMLTEVRRMARMASPLNLPADLASETVPVTPEPAGTITFPCTAIPLAQSAGEGLAVLSGPGRKRLAHADRDRPSSRNDDGFRRRRWRSLFGYWRRCGCGRRGFRCRGTCGSRRGSGCLLRRRGLGRGVCGGRLLR